MAKRRSRRRQSPLDQIERLANGRCRRSFSTPSRRSLTAPLSCEPGHSEHTDPIAGRDPGGLPCWRLRCLRVADTPQHSVKLRWKTCSMASGSSALDPTFNSGRYLTSVTACSLPFPSPYATRRQFAHRRG